MDLIKVGEKTYYLKNNTNIGIYKINNEEGYLIDTGNDKDAGKKILKIALENNFKIKGIINTHSNADHIGGNKVIQERTNCNIYASDEESAFINHPFFEPSFLYGGYPLKELNNKFLLASASKTTIINHNLPDGLDIFPLKGHFINMIGIKTSDDIFFIGDSLFSEDIINKYHIFFIYDVEAFLNTLDYLKGIKAKLFIPSHSDALTNIEALIKINEDKVKEISKVIYNLANNNTFEEILAGVFNKYHLIMNVNQYYLIGSTVKSYLTYLNNQNKLIYEFKDNKMFWNKII